MPNHYLTESLPDSAMTKAFAVQSEFTNRKLSSKLWRRCSGKVIITKQITPKTEKTLSNSTLEETGTPANWLTIRTCNRSSTPERPDHNGFKLCNLGLHSDGGPVLFYGRIE